MTPRRLSERSSVPPAAEGRSLNDIREPRSMAVQAQALADRYEAVRRLRYSRFLGLRG